MSNSAHVHSYKLEINDKVNMKEYAILWKNAWYCRFCGPKEYSSCQIFEESIIEKLSGPEFMLTSVTIKFLRRW